MLSQPKSEATSAGVRTKADLASGERAFPNSNTHSRPQRRLANPRSVPPSWPGAFSRNPSPNKQGAAALEPGCSPREMHAMSFAQILVSSFGRRRDWDAELVCVRKCEQAAFEYRAALAEQAAAVPKYN